MDSARGLRRDSRVQVIGLFIEFNEEGGGGWTGATGPALWNNRTVDHGGIRDAVRGECGGLLATDVEMRVEDLEGGESSGRDVLVVAKCLAGESAGALFVGAVGTTLRVVGDAGEGFA